MGTYTSKYTGSQIDNILSEVANKVDKVAGKSLVDDNEIERLSTVINYDDTEIKNQLAGKADKTTIPSLVTLTQTEYDALVSAGTVDDNTYYFIKEE